MERFGSAAILAGGEGRRMLGLDKLAIELGGERVAARIARILRLRFDDILVVTPRPEAFDGLGLRAIRDIVPGRGPLGGLHAALAASRSEWLYMTACDMPWQSLDWIDLLESRIETREAEESRSDPLPSSRRCLAVLARSRGYLEPFSAFYSRAFASLSAATLSAATLSAATLSAATNVAATNVAATNVAKAPAEGPERGAPSIRSLLRGKSYLSVPEQERLHLDRGDRIFESLNTPEDLAEAREDFERREKKF